MKYPSIFCLFFTLIGGFFCWGGGGGQGAGAQPAFLASSFSTCDFLASAAQKWKIFSFFLIFLIEYRLSLCFSPYLGVFFGGGLPRRLGHSMLMHFSSSKLEISETDFFLYSDHSQ